MVEDARQLRRQLLEQRHVEDAVRRSDQHEQPERVALADEQGHGADDVVGAQVRDDRSDPGVVEPAVGHHGTLVRGRER